ncbi:MAG: outer membrane protein assembly factor BamE [Wenzhouxiangellaceae bacterium]
MSRTVLLLILAVLMSGCNVVYKQNIQQGNVLDGEDLDRLETGMTKRQVMVLLGSPAIQSPFHSDRWDYINSFASRGGKADRRTLTVEFENDRVVDFSGSYLRDAAMAGTDPEDLDIIDPETNQPVLPPTELEDDTPVPTPNDPGGG